MWSPPMWPQVLGVGEQPTLTRVTRWTHAMPTYTVGHLERVTAVETALSDIPGWYAAGSALHGVGVPECIADGRKAARRGGGRHRLGHGIPVACGPWPTRQRMTW